MSDRYTIITLADRAAQRVAHGYPWVFRSDITASGSLAGIDSGELVYFSDIKGKILATGYAHPQLQLAGRVLAKGKVTIDSLYFKHQFETALKWREGLFGTTQNYRLIHADSDGLPGLVIDRFESTLVVQINSAGMEKLRPIWLPVLQTIHGVDTIILKNDATTRQLEGLESNFEIACGTLPDNGRIIFSENNVKFYADIKEGQKTGWFFDQRPHRLWIAERAKNKTLIDVFSHSGGFGITSAVHGASQVTCVDSSALALNLAKDNASLNNVSNRCQFIEGKAFDVLEEISDKQFDIVCVDPPAFVKTKKDLAAGLKGYEKLAKLACPLVKQGGILFYASCSSHPTEEEMLKAITTGIAKTGRQAFLVYTGTAGADHPIHPMLPETRYLKAFAFRVL